MTDTEIALEPFKVRFFILAPPVTLLLFGQALTGTVLTDLILYRTCLFSLNINRTECNILRTNASSPEAIKLEAEVQPYASMILLAKSLIENLLPAVASLFLGSWSDRAGRRPLFLLSLAGFTILHVSHTLISIWDTNPWYLVIPSVPAFSFGGVCAVMIAAMCHISDITAEKERTMLMTWLQASVFLGIILGRFITPWIFEHYGYTAVFGASAVCCILALTYTYFIVPETVRDASKESIREVFRISSIRELLISSLQKRDGFHRSVVWFAIFALTLTGLVFQGEISIEFLFTRARLGWDVQHYSYYSGIGYMLSMPCMVIGVTLFSRVLGFSDTLISGIAFAACLGGSLTEALATKSWHIYLAASIGFFGGAVEPVMRSVISKSVPAKDIGKVLSLTKSLETLSPLAGAPLYTLIYSHYLPPIYPSPVYLLSTSFFAVLILVTVGIGILIRKSRDISYVPVVVEDN
ncbi:tetracycline resistance protein, class D-like isoform X1 [Neodiprion lecontei]|uniref:Tetracycline resistance protein, class D-like isoform X1 n=1 Tax=Neodiprion lecontei TaxID=441921 RepID=A0A6J0BCU6_NEOLC|nr:tetracycline resistance protein, class D-like isoform X1 [Neodiprion lecontei]